MTTSEKGQRRPWIGTRAPDEALTSRLFCFPYAGASGTSVFQRWSQQIVPSIDVCPIDLPGRWGRSSEAPFRRMDPLVEALVEGLQPHLDIPFALFGYSYGALVALEVARALVARRGPLPDALFMGACSSEGLPPFDYREPSDDLFLNQLGQGLGETDRIRFSRAQPGVVDALRADIEVMRTHTYRLDAALDCPIVAYAGAHDPLVPARSMEAWRTATRGPFSLRVFDGGHFFFHDLESELIHDVARHLESIEHGRIRRPV